MAARAAAAAGLRAVPKSTNIANPAFTKKMLPPVETAPLFAALTVALSVSGVVMYSTSTRAGSDVLINKSRQKYFWENTPAEKPAHIQGPIMNRNPLEGRGRTTA